MKTNGPTIYEDGYADDGSESSTLFSSGTVFETDNGRVQTGQYIPVEKGNTILGLYKIEDDPIVGGMGRVFCVHHTNWNVNLAMKQPKRGLFETWIQKQEFVHECEAWINLGLHPHIVSCYYVREIDNIPSIFSEWMDGGNLKDYIKSKELYKGNRKEVLERILDISIQFARGLYYAHEQKLIHQDVKPDNLLLTSGGLVKVADFGIANARAKLSNIDIPSSGSGTIVANGYAYTPLYYSPEQKAGKELTRRTDIWSWAVSVLEMFVGECLWPDGVVAGYACEYYFKQSRIDIPETIKELLRYCFKVAPDNRPYDFKEIENILLQIYHTETGGAYPRPVFRAASDTADSLNNKALSYIDLGKFEEAEECWNKALEKEPDHLEVIFNQGLHLWRTLQIDDEEAVRRIKFIKNEKKSPAYYILLSRLHLERGNFQDASDTLQEGIKAFPGNRELTGLLDCFPAGKQEYCRLQIIRADQVGIRNFCINQQGNILLTRGNDNLLKVWNSDRGECIRMYEVGETWHPQGSFARLGSFSCYLSTSADGKRIAIDIHKPEPWTNYIQVFDLNTGKDTIIDMGDKQVCALGISPDGSILIATFRTKTYSGFLAYNIHTADSDFLEFTDNNRDMSFAPVRFNNEGNIFAIGCEDGIQIRDAKKLNIIDYIKTEGEEIQNFCFSADGKFILTIQNYVKVKLWDTETKKAIYSFSVLRRNDSVETPKCKIAISPDASLLLTGGYNIRLWDIKTGRCLTTIDLDSSDNDADYQVCFHPDGKSFFTTNKGNITQWSLPHDKNGIKADYELNRIYNTMQQLETEKQIVANCKWIEDCINSKNIGEALKIYEQAKQISGFISNKNSCLLFRKLTRYCIKKQVLSMQCTLELDEKTSFGPDSFCIDGRHILVRNNDKNTIDLVDIESGVCGYRFSQEDSEIQSCGFSGPYIIEVNGSDINLINTVNGCLCHRISIPDIQYDTGNILVSPGLHLLSFTTSEITTVYSLSTGKNLYSIPSSCGYKCICFSPDGEKIAYIENLFYIVIIDSFTGKRLSYFDSGCSSMYNLTFTPDGKYLAIASKKVLFFDIEKGVCSKTVGELPDNKRDSDLCSFYFTPDGQFMVSSGITGQNFNIWNVADGERIPIPPIGEDFVPVGFDITGAYLFSPLKRWTIEYKYEFPGWSDWDEGASPYLEIFIKLYPEWTDKSLRDILIPDLQNRGYGWLRPEGIKAKLQEIFQNKKSESRIRINHNTDTEQTTERKHNFKQPDIQKEYSKLNLLNFFKRKE